LRQIDFGHVERVLDIACSPRGHARLELPGVEVVRSLDWLRFAPPGFTSASKSSFSIRLPAVPSSLELPGTNIRITLQLLEKNDSNRGYATVVADLDWERVTGSQQPSPCLELRNWRPGDQYRRAGRSKQEKVKVLFQEARVPLWERRAWPIITYNGNILWIRRFGAAAEFAAGPDTRIILRVGESLSGSSNRTDPL
jgi:tRNA(Ile)-lysidine synthase